MMFHIVLFLQKSIEFSGNFTQLRAKKNPE